MPAAFFPRAFEVLFDIIAAVILFQCIRVLSRLIGRRRGDVLYYVSTTDTLVGEIYPSTGAIRLKRAPRWIA